MSRPTRKPKNEESVDVTDELSILGKTSKGVSWQSNFRSNIWSPPTDFYETANAFVARVEIAGMNEKDFEIIVEDNILIISGSRPNLPERRAYHQMEIRIGKFEIFISLPSAINIDESRADYEEGFLVVTLPKFLLPGDDTTDAPPPEDEENKSGK